MSLSSLPFVYGFLPGAVLLFFLCAKISRNAAAMALVLLSAVFFALNGIPSAIIFLASLSYTFYAGKKLQGVDPADDAKRNEIVVTAVFLNLVLLAACKYASLALPFLSLIHPIGVDAIALPLGISFYTFTHISYLVEVRTGKVAAMGLMDFLVYVTFFPKILAGPIVRPSEFLAQTQSAAFCSWNGERVLKGLSFFFIGLCKKLFIADQLSPFADKVFDAAIVDKTLSFYQAWYGAVAYGLQLYFDFSGYTDMAIGAALLFGIGLPVNFDSPYKSVNITQFWRKWHMTLSFFFRDYLYIALGGNRQGAARKYLNLFIVMTLCGVWHGSGVTFVLWGMMHGAFLIVHNLWVTAKKSRGLPENALRLPGRLVASLATFLLVTVAWVPFRAQTLPAVWHMYTAMVRMPTRTPTYVEWILLCSTVLIPLAIVWLMPTSQKWLRYGIPEAAAGETVPAKQSFFGWKVNLLSGLAVGVLVAVGVMSMGRGAEFIYGNF